MSDRTELVRFYVVGGFLGAGKTTALTALAGHFNNNGQKVAIITNDQTDGLVDSEVVRTHGIQYREISGACFCTRFRDFLESADTLLQENQPKVILAEPVGSAADLIATVIKPLRAYTQDRYAIMPLTVLADPYRVREMFQDNQDSEEDQEWPEEIRYLYSQQLQEADFILLTKSDLTSDSAKERAKNILKSQYQTIRPNLRILPFSGLTGEGLPEWLAAMDEYKSCDSPSLDSFDRDRHARAEACLGWLNLETQLIFNPETGFDLTAFIQGFLQRLKDRMNDRPVGHLKIFAESNGQTIKANLVDWRQGYSLDTIESKEKNTQAGHIKFLVNVRAIQDPNQLMNQSMEALREVATLQNAAVNILKEKALRPGKPKPTFRIGGID